jgi:hypothetical protein
MARPGSAPVGDPYMRAHLDEALIENARFLLDSGEHIERVARRLGVSVDKLEQTMYRRGS